MHFATITEANYNQVAKIYQLGISTAIATFETEVPDYKAWDRKFLKFGRITLEDSQGVCGWSALTKTSDRIVYRGVAEVSLYVHPKKWRNKIGTRLLMKQIEESEKNGIWTLQCGIMEENKASIELHKKCGFRIIGVREKIACLNNVWKNNVIMEKRSEIIGIN